jgi:hypothetical protein
MPDPKLDKLKKLKKLSELKDSVATETDPKTLKLQKLKEEASAWETATGLASEFDKGLINTLVTSPVKLGGALQRTLMGAMGYPEEIPLPNMPSIMPDLELAGQVMEQGVENLFPTDERINETARGVASGLGQGMGMMVTGGPKAIPITPSATAVPSLLKATGNAVQKLGASAATPAGILGGIQSAMPAYEEAKASGLNDEDAFGVLVKNYFIGQTEALPIQSFFSKLNKLTGGGILEKLKIMGTGSLEEAAQEAVQTYLSNQVAKADYDPERDPIFQVLESAKVGGIVGFILPGIASFSSPKTKSKIDKLRDTAIAVLPADPVKAAQQDSQFEEITKDLNGQENQKTETVIPEAGQPVVEETGGTDAVIAPAVPASFDQTPEWRSSDDKVRQLSDVFRTESSPENLAAVNEAIQERDNARIAFETKTPGIKPEYIRTTKLQTWKDKFNNINRGIRMGRTDTKAAVKQLGKDISDFMEGQNLSTSQQNAILRRTTGININNPVQVEKLFTYVNNIMNDSKYDERIGTIKNKLKDVKTRLRNNHYTSHTPDVQRLLNINPSNIPVERLGTYEEVVDGLTKAKVADPRALRGFIDNLEAVNQVPEEVAPFRTTQEVEEYIASIPEVKSIEDFKEAKRKLKAAQNQLQQLASQEFIDDEEAERIAQDIEEFSATLEGKLQAFPEEAEAFRKQRILEAAQVLQTEGDVEFTPRQQEVIDKFKSLDLSTASVNEVEDYFRISEGISNGVVNKAIYDYISKANKKQFVGKYSEIAQEASKEFDKQRKFFGLFNIGKLNPIKDPQKLINRLKLIHGQRWDRKFLLSKDNPIWTNIIRPVNVAAQKAETDINKDMKRVLKTTKDLKEDQSIKVGMILSQMDHEATRKEDQPKDKFKYLFNGYPEHQKQHLEDAKPVLGVAKVENYKKIYEAMPKTDGEIDIQKAIDSLSPKERTAFNTLKDFFNDGDFRDKIRIANEMRGNLFLDRGDYFPIMVRQRVRKGKDADTVKSFVEEMLSTNKRGLGVRSGRSYERSGEIYFSELDVNKVATHTIKEVNRDFHLTEAIRDNVGALNLTADALEGEQRGMMDAMYQAMKERVATEYNLKFVDEDAVHNVINWYTGFRRTMALANPLRVPNDFTSNTLRLVIEGGGDFNKALHPAYTELMKMQNSILLGKTGKYAQEFVKADDTWGKKAATSLITAGDVFPVRVKYTTSFNKKFKELTGSAFNPEKFGDEEYRTTHKKAIEKANGYAEAQTQDLFNSQSTFSAPSHTKLVPFKDVGLINKKSAVAKVFGYMQSFTINETAEMVDSFRDLALGTNEGRVKAARRMAALSASNYAYMNGALFMLNVLRAAADDEKELEDLLAEQFSLDKQWKVLLASMGSLVVGRYGNLIRPVVTLWIADLYNILSKSDVGNKEELKGDLDVINDLANTMFFTGTKPLNVNRDSPTRILRLIPTLGDALADAVESGKTLTDLVVKDPESMDDKERAQWDALLMMNQGIALMYPNPISPSAERIMKAKKFAVKKEEPVNINSDLPSIPDLPSVPETPSIPDLP